MPAFLTSILGLPKWVRYGGAIIAAALLLWGLKAIYDHSVISKHDAKLDAEISSKALDAERTANANDEQRREEDEAASAKTTEAMKNAEAENPDAARNAAGPVTRSVTDSLRDRAAKNSGSSR